MEYKLKLAAPRGYHYLATFFSIYITNVVCTKTRVGHACICPRMVTGEPVAVVKLYPPQKLVFPRPNKNDENSPRTGNGMRTPTFKKKSQIHFFLSSFSAVLVRNSVTPMSTLANNDKRSCSSQKRGKFQPKMIAFFLFSGEKFAGTILSRSP